MQSLDVDTQSIGGGGGFGGFGGGGGSNPLLWLVTLAFLRGGSGFGFGGDDKGDKHDGGGAAAILAGQTQSKLDCLQQGHNSLSSQIREQSEGGRFNILNQQISELAGIGRDGHAAQTAQVNDLSRQLSDCCCDIKTGQVEIRNSISQQTSVLLADSSSNTQKILDKISDGEIRALETENDRLRADANAQKIINELSDKHGRRYGIEAE